MCGIIGYIGPKDVVPVLIDGLRRLEYRGYDSAGGGGGGGGAGGPRPRRGRIVVVHNGIIENYLDLKHELEGQGHRFVTETDTEIVAHLVEREMRDDGLEEAVRRALMLMRGLFALVLISADDPGKIVAVRNGPPIVVRLCGQGLLLASGLS